MKTKTKRVQVYIAEDGTEFRTEAECVKYEKNISWDKLLQYLEKHCLSKVEVYDCVDGKRYSRVLHLEETEFKELIDFFTSNDGKKQWDCTMHYAGMFTPDPSGNYMYGGDDHKSGEVSFYLVPMDVFARNVKATERQIVKAWSKG